MSEGEWEINEIGMGGSGLTIRVPASNRLRPDPGQYYLTFAPGQIEPLAAALFFSGGDSNEWALAGDFPRYWQPGTRLRWRGPLGNGFHLPGSARRVALVSRGMPIFGLTALVNMALMQNASVVWYCDTAQAQLPIIVEVLPLDSLAEVWEWADYLAVEWDLAQLTSLAVRLFGSGKPTKFVPAQILLHTAMPCGGTGDCGACAVPTKKGWKLACKDGPVFDLDQLDLNG